MQELLKLPAYKLAEMIRHKKISSVELVKCAINQVRKLNPTYNAVISLRTVNALQEAATIKDNGQPFLGVPLLIKGLGQQLVGEPDTSGSYLFKHQRATYTSNFVKCLQAAGFIIIGQTNYPEFGFKNITDSKLYGATHNAWNIAYQAGGSSGGAAAAVSLGMVPIATGNDGGGSIRIPAAWNGLIGLKPTRGRVVVGPQDWRAWQGAAINFGITRNVKDTALLLYAAQGVQDAAIFQCPLLTINDERLSHFKIGYTVASPVGTPVSSAAKKAVYAAVNFLQNQGFETAEVKIPYDGIKLMRSYYLMNAVETTAMLQGMRINRHDVEPLTWALYHMGKQTQAVDYSLALQYWDEVGARMAAFHVKYPLLLTPTNAFSAPHIQQVQVSAKDQEPYWHINEFSSVMQQQLIYDLWLPSLRLTPFTQLANLTGEPAITLPTALDQQSNLPLGIQLQAAKGREDLLLKMARLFEIQGQFKMH